jgi:hypothetical protein
MDIINKRASSIPRKENIYGSLRKADLLFFENNNNQNNNNNTSSLLQRTNQFKPSNNDLKSLLESTLKAKRDDLSRKTSDLFENRISSSKLFGKKSFFKIITANFIF